MPHDYQQGQLNLPFTGYSGFRKSPIADRKNTLTDHGLHLVMSYVAHYQQEPNYV
ncbi:hypothetical protein [Vibrio sp. WXL103]|uniref:hypothetical protein n=1 Tax=Vibrio sp. WXL103 TaxID=3450710 RepID=UPI003EC506C5